MYTEYITLQLLQQSLTKLDTWEQYVEDKVIPPSYFLTRQTAEGLRVTLQSTLDLIAYLVDSGELDSVATGRLNQDPLEV